MDQCVIYLPQKIKIVEHKNGGRRRSFAVRQLKSLQQKLAGEVIFSINVFLILQQNQSSSYFRSWKTFINVE